MMNKPRILAFAGSLRKHSFSKRVVKTALKGAEKAGAEVTYVDLRDYPMPLYNPDDHEELGFDHNALRLQQLMAQHDGFLIASPEYNGSLSAVLKNTIDWTSRKNDKYELGQVFAGKVAAIMTSSPGSLGGVRSLAHLRGVLTSLRLIVLPAEIAVPYAGNKFEGDQEEMIDERIKGNLERLGAALVETLKRMRS
jgi:NAD(P)H-dependent FMN reductase